MIGQLVFILKTLKCEAQR